MRRIMPMKPHQLHALLVSGVCKIIEPPINLDLALPDELSPLWAAVFRELAEAHRHSTSGYDTLASAALDRCGEALERVEP